MQITDEPKAIELHSNITLWLQNNRHLPTISLVATVKHMLEGAEPMVLLHYAAELFILKDLLTQEIEAADELKEAHSELEIARKEIDKADRVKDLITKAIISLTTDHFKTVSTQRKDANSTRVKNYKAVENKLKQYWQNNFRPDKKATEVAILLENTDIYKKCVFQSKLPPKPLECGHLNRSKKPPYRSVATREVYFYSISLVVVKFACCFLSESPSNFIL